MEEFVLIVDGDVAQELERGLQIRKLVIGREYMEKSEREKLIKEVTSFAISVAKKTR